MSKHKINLWSGIDSTGMFATLKDGKELLNDFDKITKSLINMVRVNLEGLTYDELMDWIESCNEDELLIAQELLSRDYRLSEVIRIQLKKYI